MKLSRLTVLLCLLGIPGLQADPVPDSVLQLPGTNNQLQLHLFMPGNEIQPQAAVLLLHGGGWRDGAPEQLFPHARLLADEGFAAYVGQIRRAGAERTIEDSLDDAIAVATHFAESTSGMPRFLLGESSGGHLAAMVAMRTTPEQWAGVILWNPVLDLTKIEWLQADIAPLASREQLSPIHSLYPALPPFLIVHGRTDDIVPFTQIEDFAESCLALRVPCRIDLLHEHGHAFAFDDSSTKEYSGKQEALRRSLSFMRSADSRTLMPGNENSTYAFSLLHNFSGEEGSQPFGGLVSDGQQLYGVTHSGGVHGKGVLFAIQTDGSLFKVLHHFSGPDGRQPFERLTIDGDWLYGVTKFGGTNGLGTLFRIRTDGTQFETLHQFADAPDNGWHPHAGPLLIDNTLYGTTFHGGSNRFGGTLYRYDLDSSEFSLLQNMHASVGEHPTGRLIENAGWLYGFASDYGKESRGRFGSIFRIRPDGTDFTLLHRFGGGSMGAHPYDSPVFVNQDTLLGTTFGAFGSGIDTGTLFTFNVSTNEHRTLLDFAKLPAVGAKPNSPPFFDESTKRWLLAVHGSDTQNGMIPGTVIQFDWEPGSALRGLAIVRSFENLTTGFTPTRNFVEVGQTLFAVASFGGVSNEATDNFWESHGIIYALMPPVISESGSDRFNWSGFVLIGAILIASGLLFSCIWAYKKRGFNR